jgi:hypothetical protein
MAKGNTTKDDNNKFPGDDNVTFKQSEEEIYRQSEDSEKSKVQKTVTLVFKQNRHKELHVAGNVYHFWGAERITVPKEVITHPDFKTQEHYFTVKEA